MRIEIVPLRGMLPKLDEVLLPNEAAAKAEDCQFDRGLLAPLRASRPLGVTLPLVPRTLFRYTDTLWFAWGHPVTVMRSPIAQDAYQRVYYTDGVYPKVTYQAIATGSGPLPNTWYRLGVPAPTTPPVVAGITAPAGQQDDTPTDDETRYYTETYVTGLGEEGAPGPQSEKIVVRQPGSSVSVTLSPSPTTDSNVTHRHLYRSATGGGAADFRRVAVLPLATTTYTDVLAADALGPALETYGYAMPPDELRGLCQMANGIAAGFAGNAVYLCEPYLPYAWPDKYRLTTTYPIVALAAIDTALVVMTEGYPELIEGASPSAMTARKFTYLPQACVSAESVVTMTGLVLYASADGLVGISQEGGQVVTRDLITPAQWQALQPHSLRAWYHQGRYIALTDTHGLIYDPHAGDLRGFSQRWDAAWLDSQRGELIVADQHDLHVWQGGTQPVTMLWRSRAFVLPPSYRLTVARVVSEDVSQLGFTLRVDGHTVFELAAGHVPDTAFRLPPLRGRTWQVDVSGTAAVERIVLGSSRSEVMQG